ncbi:MAG: hypothetical protein N2749_03765 [Clostridia bacterium]|nr:hypothetical protein [Clostridia bacterium]
MGSINRGSFKVNKVSTRSSNNTKAYNNSLASNSNKNKSGFRDKLKNSSSNFKVQQKSQTGDK